MDENKINETNLNVNSFMESLEDFSTKKVKDEKKMTVEEERDINDEREELEMEYLRKFL